MHTFDVIVVGAGISGLSAARTLIQNGIENILILEAKEKAGGRINSETCGDGDSFLELGAQWIHGEENELFEMIKNSLHLHDKSSWEGKGEFRTPGGLCVNETIVKEVIDWVENTLGDVEDNMTIETFQQERDKWDEDEISLGSHLRKEFQNYLKNYDDDGPELQKLRNAIFQWGMSFQRIDNSCNQMSELSLFRWSEYKANGAHVYRNFTRGAQNFVNEILVNSGPLNSKILFKTPVKVIDWSEDIVKLTSDAAEHFQCSSVLVTCSMGVLKENEHLFVPPLPQSLANAILVTGYGPVTKIFLEWENPWWTSQFLGVQLIHEDEWINYCDFDHQRRQDLRETWYKAITGFDPVFQNPNVLLAWLGGPEAIYAETISTTEIGDTCAKILRQFTGNSCIPQPKSVKISMWNTDPHFRGAYSFRSKQGDRIPDDITATLSEPIYKFEINARKASVYPTSST